MKKIFLLLLSGILLSACNSKSLPSPVVTEDTPSASPTEAVSTVSSEIVVSPDSSTSATESAKIINNKTKKMFATFQTSKGNIKVELFVDKTPITVANFVGLVNGTKDWVDPKTGEKMVGKRFYDGLIFHRVIKDFMIQGGCPLGTGTGDPGYRFADEFDKSLTFDKPGMLAMANSGPNTNGSQFFITTVPTAWLNNKHTIFGKIVEGMDIVKLIENVATDPSDKPITPVIINSITTSEN